MFSYLCRVIQQIKFAINFLKHSYQIAHRINDLEAKSYKFAEIENTIKRLDVSVDSILNNYINLKYSPKAQGLERKIQLINLKSLVFIDKICRKHNLRYWLDFGTLLGAVRHSGFIPWDDDIDIGMLSDDFEKLKEILDQEIEGVEFRVADVPSQILKVLHQDFYPEDECQMTDFIFWRLKGKLAFCLDIFPYYRSSITQETLFKNLDRAVKKKTVALENVKIVSEFKRAGELVKNFNAKNSDDFGPYIYLGIETRVYQPLIYSSDDIFPLKEMDFEGYKFFVPNKTFKILQRLYGEYNKPPRQHHQHLYLSSLNFEQIKKLENINTLDLGL